MINRLKLIVAMSFISIAVVWPTLANASSMRCGTHLITAGMRDSPGMYEVLKRCGEPTARYGDTWIYQRSSSITKKVTFSSNGQLRSIE